MTNGPPLAIFSLIGLPEINKNFAFDEAKTFKAFPVESKIKVLSFNLLCFSNPISISPFIKYMKLLCDSGKLKLNSLFAFNSTSK